MHGQFGKEIGTKEICLALVRRHHEYGKVRRTVDADVCSWVVGVGGDCHHC